MNQLSKEQVSNFFNTSAGEDLFEKLKDEIMQETISAAKYYMGVPDRLYFQEKDFDESVVNAKKAYITINTIMGGDTAEEDRFKEGKKQVYELMTPLGIKKIVKLITYLYFFGCCNEDVSFETVRACRQTEVTGGVFTVEPLTSTTKLSISEIIELGYADKNGLAICNYKFHKGAVIFDMESLGKDYLKPEEREVLILPGNVLSCKPKGYHKKYVGRDGKPAFVYDIDVYAPDFEEVSLTKEQLENIVCNRYILEEIKKYFKALNEDGDFPKAPQLYKRWKNTFKALVFLELKNLTNNK